MNFHTFLRPRRKDGSCLARICIFAAGSAALCFAEPSGKLQPGKLRVRFGRILHPSVLRVHRRARQRNAVRLLRMQISLPQFLRISTRQVFHASFVTTFFQGFIYRRHSAIFRLLSMKSFWDLWANQKRFRECKMVE